MAKKTTTGTEVYAHWNDIIEANIRWMQQKYHENWKRYIRMYQGNHWNTYISRGYEQPSADNPRTLITVNEVGSLANMILSFLVSRDTEIICRPTHPSEIISARLQQQEANYCWRRYDFQSQKKKAVLDSIVIGHGIGKTGYNLEVDTSKDPQEQIYYEDYIKQDAPFFKRVSPFLFYFDPEAPEHNLETARYCFELIPKAPEDIMNNRDFDQSVINAIPTGRNARGSGKSPNTISSIFKETEGRLKWDFLSDEDRERWVLVELWDKKYRKRYIFLSGIDKPLAEDPWPHEHMDSLPYVMLPYIPNINDHYPIGLVAWLDDHQYELDRHVTQLFDYRRQIIGGQVEVVSTGIDPTELNKFRSGQRVNEVTQRNTINPIQAPTLPTDIWRIEAEMRQNMRNLSGVDELMRGGNLADRASATEVNARANMMALKTDARKAEVDNFDTKVARQTIGHIKAYWRGDRVAQLAGAIGEYWGKVSDQPPGPDGKYWAPYSKEDIQAEADVEVISSVAPRYDPIAERQQMLSLFQTTVQALPVLSQVAQSSNQPLPDLLKLYRTLLEKFDERDAAEWFSGMAVAPAPVQEQTALQQGGNPAPEVPFNAPTTTQEAQSAANPAMAAILGQLMGGMNGGAS